MIYSDIVFRFRGGTAAEWAASGRILEKGEPGIEEDTNKFKLGDGVSRYSDLPYFIDKMAVEDLIEAYLDSLEGGPVATPTGAPVATFADLTGHINSETPHPVYDDGISLVLLYQNAKV